MWIGDKRISGGQPKHAKPVVFVFGSNLAGRHGRGAAQVARRFYGAVYGRGIGYHGSSYAIPTKGWDLEVLSLGRITTHVQDFIAFCRKHPELTFSVTRIGCGLAGYKDVQIAPMFAGAAELKNVELPKGWLNIILEVKAEESGVGQAPDLQHPLVPSVGLIGKSCPT